MQRLQGLDSQRQLRLAMAAQGETGAAARSTQIRLASGGAERLGAGARQAALEGMAPMRSVERLTKQQLDEQRKTRQLTEQMLRALTDMGQGGAFTVAN